MIAPCRAVFDANSLIANDVKQLTRSEAETETLGRDFAGELKAGDLVALHGPLGSGKTVFARGVCLGLGCTVDAHSPSFNIVNFYPGKVEVAHIDLYRVDDDVQEIGWYDLLGSERVIIVEWADKAKKDLPPSRFDVFFVIVDSNRRQITITKRNDPRH